MKLTSSMTFAALSFFLSSFLSLSFAVDDTYSTFDSSLPVQNEKTDHGNSQLLIPSLAPFAQIDARNGRFHLVNSTYANPSLDQGCAESEGPLAADINKYPLLIRNSPRVTLFGGKFNGRISMTSDWRFIYRDYRNGIGEPISCNAVSISIAVEPPTDPNVSQVSMAEATVDGIRMRRTWDGIRFADFTRGPFEDSKPRMLERFLITNSWFSDCRDDCIENDHLINGRIKDTLMDGAFAGISIADDVELVKDRSQRKIILDGVLLRMKPYLFTPHSAPLQCGDNQECLNRTKVTHGAPIKTGSNVGGPRIEMYDSIIALSSNNMSRGAIERMTAAWQLIDQTKCHRNRLLWLGEGDIPSAYIEHLPDDLECFQVKAGQEAQEIWNNARQNWINCHPNVNRFETDPQAIAGSDQNPELCKVTEYGGRN